METVFSRVRLRSSLLAAILTKTSSTRNRIKGKLSLCSKKVTVLLELHIVEY